MFSKYRISLLFTFLPLISIASTTILFVSARTPSSTSPQLKIAEKMAEPMQEQETGADSSQPTFAQGASEKEVEVEVIALRTGGFAPAQITRPRGPFLLVIDNRSGVEVSAFEIRHEDGSLRHSMRARGHKISWQQMLNLPPGRYLLQPPAYPSISCRLIITAR